MVPGVAVRLPPSTINVPPSATPVPSAGTAPIQREGSLDYEEPSDGLWEELEPVSTHGDVPVTVEEKRDVDPHKYSLRHVPDVNYNPPAQRRRAPVKGTQARTATIRATIPGHFQSVYLWGKVWRNT